MKAFVRWSVLEIVLTALSLGAFSHAYLVDAYDWEMYAAAVISTMTMVVSVIGLKRANKPISAFCGSTALFVLCYSVTEIMLAYAFTGHLP